MFFWFFWFAFWSLALRGRLLDAEVIDLDAWRLAHPSIRGRFA